jgi:hypothetical protein
MGSLPLCGGRAKMAREAFGVSALVCATAWLQKDRNKHIRMQNLLNMALDRSVGTGITLSVTGYGLEVTLERGRLVDFKHYAN